MVGPNYTLQRLVASALRDNEAFFCRPDATKRKLALPPKLVSHCFRASVGGTHFEVHDVLAVSRDVVDTLSA